MSGLRSTRSAANSRVTLLTTETKPDVKPDIDVNGFTSLRRATRSTTRTEPEASSSKSTLDLSKYSYAEPARKRVKREVKEEDELVEVKDEPVSPVRRRKEKAAYLPAREKAHPEPPKWREQYALIERMRAGIDAPVDTMGCERPRTMGDLDDKTLRFHILISLMLSSQTKDAVTSQAVMNLHESIAGGLTAATLAIAPESTVADAINKVGFWRRKTEYIQAAARELVARPDGDVPQTIEELCQLKGVGPKMGFLALQAAWNINAGIGVDVHVHRITNRLKWHKPPTKTPEDTRVNLESWLPPELHRPINPLLVGFGQVICLPVGPRCDICLLGQQKLCPSRVTVNAANRKEIAFRFTADDDVKREVEETKPKVEIAYEEEEEKLRPAVDEIDGVDKLEGEATVDAISVKIEP
ncbi:hypothetical protein CspHIS471_0305100 [Cutaneotrichosporon sp. HIS471]|nr:hypothetical protein CspHIS471_0305100 [Cutaneotrichosporon sp. HIS471]